MEEDAPELELVSPRISFSHDLASFAAAAPPSRRSDASRDSSSRLPDDDPDFDFANASAAAADVAPADRLFAGGRLLPMPPLPPAPSPKPTSPPCKQQQSSCGIDGGGGGRVKAQAAAWQQRLPAGSWASPLFSRSSSVNSATTATAGAPRSTGRFGCPTFPLMRSWSAGSAAAARGDGLVGGAAVSDTAAGRRPHHHQCYKKFGGGAAAACNNGPGGSSRAYYYGGSRKGSSGRHGVRVSPVLNVPFIGTSVANVLSYLLCDCSHKTKKSREF